MDHSHGRKFPAAVCPQVFSRLPMHMGGYGRYLRLDRTVYVGADGVRREWETATRVAGSDIVAVFAVTSDDTVIAIEQLRPTIVPSEQFGKLGPRRALGLIAGLCDEPGEERLATAKREMLEEAGCIAERWIPIPMQAECKGVSDGIVHTWLALNARRVAALRLGPAEAALGLRTVELPLRELPHALLRYAEETGNVVDPKLMTCRGWVEHFTGRRF